MVNTDINLGIHKVCEGIKNFKKLLKRYETLNKYMDACEDACEKDSKIGSIVDVDHVDYEHCSHIFNSAEKNKLLTVTGKSEIFSVEEKIEILQNFSNLFTELQKLRREEPRQLHYEGFDCQLFLLLFLLGVVLGLLYVVAYCVEKPTVLSNFCDNLGLPTKMFNEGDVKIFFEGIGKIVYGEEELRDVDENSEKCWFKKCITPDDRDESVLHVVSVYYSTGNISEYQYRYKIVGTWQRKDGNGGGFFELDTVRYNWNEVRKEFVKASEVVKGEVSYLKP